MEEELVYEIEVDADSVIVELPVNENNLIELDYSHLEIDDDLDVHKETEDFDVEPDDMYDNNIEDEQSEFNDGLDY